MLLNCIFLNTGFLYILDINPSQIYEAQSSSKFIFLFPNFLELAICNIEIYFELFLPSKNFFWYNKIQNI